MNTTTRNALGASCALALACSALAGCAKPTAAATPTVQSTHQDDGSITVDKMSPLRQRLQIAPVQEQEIATQTDAPGSIEAMPEKLVKITPPLSGRITRLQRALGDSVKAGDALFTLDSAELSAAHADNSKAKSALLQARQELQRQKTLFEAEIAARKDYEAAQAAFDPAGLTILQANGAVGGQTVGHFHLHVVPRHEGDGIALSWPRKEPLASVLQGYAAQLRGALESSAPAPLQ